MFPVRGGKVATLVLSGRNEVFVTAMVVCDSGLLIKNKSSHEIMTNICLLVFLCLSGMQ